MNKQFDNISKSQKTENKINDLLSRMTIEEKISQMLHNSPAIERLNIPAYNWWNECLHGVARAGIATVFPQAIGMAATFNTELIFEIATAISSEARGKYNQSQNLGDHGIYKGLTFWTPNINIFRDPRWGRGHETYGEDPYLTGEIGSAFVRGLQGDHPEFLKTIATPKHFAVHSGPEAMRHSFDVNVSPKDLWETYLPAFEKCITEAKAFSVMGAYNRLYGEPACASKLLLEDILRNKWNFEGYVVSDCGAINDFHEHHKVTSNPADSAALAVKAGCDLNCGNTYQSLLDAYDEGLISEEVINKSVARLFQARIKLGMFEKKGRVPYDSIPYQINNCEKHHQLSIEAAAESLVLLQNKNKILPIKRETKSIAVIGPNADSRKALIGNYYGTADRWITPLQGIRNEVDENTIIHYSQGCHLYKKYEPLTLKKREQLFAEAITAAKNSDIVIMFLGLDAEIEGEAGDAFNSEASGDKVDLKLPGRQQELLEEVTKIGKPVILNLISGSPLALNWAQENVEAVIQCWYPGPEGGKAISDILFGKSTPSGRLPITFVNSINDLPPFDDYSMKNRTYKYIETKPLYPFGLGLTYGEFRYSKLNFMNTKFNENDLLEFTVEVTNQYVKKSQEVVQIYFKNLDSQYVVPNFQLISFKKVEFEPNETKTVIFSLPAASLSCFTEKGDKLLKKGRYIIYAGGSQPDERSYELTGKKVLNQTITVH